MSWTGEKHRHAMSARGVSTKLIGCGRKKIKLLSDISKLPFDYEQAGYDTNTLLLIPGRANIKRHAVYDIKEYIEYLKGKSSIGEDTTITIYFKSFKHPIAFNMDTYDIDNKTITGWFPNGRKIVEKFNPNITTQVADIKNVVTQDAFSTNDFYGELIHDYELKEFDFTPLRAIFYDNYKDVTALRLKDLKWVKIESPHNIAETTKGGN